MNQEMQTEKYIGTTPVAKFLGLSVGSVQKLVDEGTLPGYLTKGGHRRVNYAALLRYREKLLMKLTGPVPDELDLNAPITKAVGVVFSAAQVPRCIRELSNKPQYCLISDPVQLLQHGRSLDQFFMDARLPWMNWLKLEQFTQTSAHLVIYQSQVLSDQEKDHLKDLATLTEADITPELLEGYRIGQQGQAVRLRQTALGLGRVRN